MRKVLYFDVEWANSQNKSICHMGLVSEDFDTGEPILLELNVYVDPEDKFDRICMEVHHITSAKVKGCKSFPKIWEDTSDYFINSVIIGHNVKSADLNALVKKKHMKEIKYIEIDGLLYPDLKLSEQKEVHLSRFGRMKKQYLKEEHSIIYINLLVRGKLFDYLENFDNEMNELYNRLVEQYKINWNVTEELKGKDQMRWIQEMNNIQQCVEEFIKSEYIYQLEKGRQFAFPLNL